MSSIESIQTENAPAAIGPYSQAIKAGQWLYCSGQIALHPSTGEMVGETAGQQARQCMENMTGVLTAAGCNWSQVVKATIFLADMADFSQVNEVYETYVGEPAPARACVAVRQLPKNGLVEVDCVVFMG